MMKFGYISAAYVAITCSQLLLVAELHAEILSYQAVDFPVLDAGEVPFHSEAPYRSSLAINASVEEYRDKYAKASMTFEGHSGFYDITIIGLAELDGEAPYRLLINDVLIGTANNPETNIDYSPVPHSFDRVVVPSGSTISVESLANSNRKIPEGNGTAFARGRWTSLVLNNDLYEQTSANANDVDLTLSVSSDKSVVYPGKQVTLGVTVSNLAGSAVATGGMVVITRPSAEFAVLSMGSCIDTGNKLECSLAELAPDSEEHIEVMLEALHPSPSAMLRIEVSADQEDSSPGNNSIILPLSIGEDESSETEAEAQSETEDTIELTGDGGGSFSLYMLFLLGIGRALLMLRNTRLTSS